MTVEDVIDLIRRWAFVDGSITTDDVRNAIVMYGAERAASAVATAELDREHSEAADQNPFPSLCECECDIP